VVIIKFIPYGKQYIDEYDIEEVIKVLKSDFITQGPKIGEFEEKLADYSGSKYAVTFNSGTSALHGAYFAFGLGKGDEVITSPNTFVATSNAALYLNASPVFSDIEINTGNIDVFKVEEKITEKTKLIVPVHYSGNPVDLKELSRVAEDNNIKIIEDAAHSIGADYNGEKIGSCRYSEMSIFSFHPVKHITTGEGGAVLTNNEDYYEKLLMFRSHGITKNRFVNEPDGDWYYEMQHLGFNYRITDIQSALGLSQLKKLDKFVGRRREIAKLYEKAFAGNPFFKTTIEKDGCKSSYHLYPILLRDEYKDKKSEIFQKLREEGLGVQVHYIPVYLQPYYQKLGYKKNSCPISEDFYQKEISIPMYPTMDNESVYYVINKIFKVFGSFK
jgi:UDP-4-amino-4,6-dideoxy-N-acetyl-beta-L-altrosamine transaminase